MILRRTIFTLSAGIFAILLVYMPCDCYSQDSINKEKYLVVEKIKSLTGRPLKHPTYIIIREGRKVSIKRYNNDIFEKGKIDFISDSSISISGKQININEIQKIRANKGIKETIIGMSSSVFFASLIVIMDRTYQPHYNDYGDDVTRNSLLFPETLCGMFVLTGGIIAIAGIIDMTICRNYNLDKNFKLIVSQKNKK